MPKKKGDHFKRKEVKSHIIEYILDNNGHVGEPAIRDNLKMAYGVIDQGTINRHLHDLKDLACIELIPPTKKGLRNHWDIKKMENLRNISFHFPDVRLNKYVAISKRILEELGHNVDSPNASRLRAQMISSYSFFNMYLLQNIRDLNTKAYEMYQFDASFNEALYVPKFEEDQRIQKCADDVYNELIKEFSKIPDVWLASYKKHIKGSQTSTIYQNSLKNLPNVRLLKESFLRILDGQPSILDMGTNVESKEEWHRVIIKEMSIKISSTIFQEILSKFIETREVYRNKGDFSQIPPEILNKILEDVKINMSDEIFKKAIETPETYRKIIEIQKYQCVSRLNYSDLIFKHCIRTDILEGTVTPEEKKFESEVQKITVDFFVERDKDLESAVKNYDKFFSEYLEKYRKRFEIYKLLYC